MTVLSLIILTIEAYAILSFIVKREIIKLFEKKGTRKTIEKYQNNKGNNQTNNGKSEEKNEGKCEKWKENKLISFATEFSKSFAEN